MFKRNHAKAQGPLQEMTRRLHAAGQSFALRIIREGLAVESGYAGGLGADPDLAISSLIYRAHRVARQALPGRQVCKLALPKAVEPRNVRPDFLFGSIQIGRYLLPIISSNQPRPPAVQSRSF